MNRRGDMSENKPLGGGQSLLFGINIGLWGDT